jgi:tetratricopeptide (TPR) repeat protein
LEAQAVPYTPEELAVMKQNPSPASTQAPLPAPAQAAAPAPAAMPAPPAASKHIAHSMKDLPPGAGALMTEARRAAMERDYAKAAGKYEEILRQDPDNVYVLGHLAKTQYDMGQLGECEKTAIRSVALDPDDPAGLYILGVLRYRQERLDEALDALSRSARFNPTNAGTQYYLGNVLAEKGLRQASETAFRKALQCEPDYAEAHYGLACVYAEEKPPSLELARWHYRRSLDLGHDKNQALEKALAPISPQ